MYTIECLVRMPCRVGESPVWDAEHGQLLWADILSREIYALEFATGRRRQWTFNGPVGSFGIARSGRLVVAIGNGVYLFDMRTEKLELLARVEEDRPTNRLNDGKVGPDGAFWVGSMDDRPTKEPVAALYRVTADGRVERKIDGLKISNGLAWSADGRTMFHSDSRGPWIDRWNFDAATGAISGRHRIRTLADEEGRPDGGATDVEGCYWSCGVSAGCINRFAPDGTLLARIPVPVPAPTMPCFGGPDMRTLFFTSLRDGLSQDTLARVPDSGSVFMMRVDVTGVPVGTFAD